MFLNILLHSITITFELHLALFALAVTMLSIAFIIWEKNRVIKEKSKRMQVAKGIVDDIHKNFDVENTKEISVQSIGAVLEADRCLIVEYNPVGKKFSKVNNEYLSSPEVLSLKGDLPLVQATRVTNTCINNKILNISDASKYISQNNLEDTLIESFYLKYSVKSVLLIPIRHSGKILGAMVLHYTRKTKSFNDDDIQFVKGIADSIGVAIYQSNLYEQERKISRRDLLLREITESIRSSLDINKMKQSIVDEIGKAFGADRCYLREYNRDENLFLKPEVEYLASDEIESLMGVEPNQKGLNYFFEAVKDKRDFVPVEVTHHYLKEKTIKDPDLEKYFLQSNIKSDFAVPVWDKKGKLTFLVLHYIKEKVNLNEADKELLVALAKQVSIALEQSTLYDEAKIQAEREKTARKIVDIIRSSLDLNDILTSVATELLSYFGDVQRVFIGKVNFKDRQDYVEVTTRGNVNKFSDVDDYIYDLIADYWENFVFKGNKKKIINKIEESDMPDRAKEIYTAMGVKSILAIPIKSKEEIWGGLFLSSIDNYKKWNENDIAFLESIVTQLDVAIRQSELFNSVLMANKRNNDILNSIPFMVWLKDKKSRFIAVNERFSQMAKTSIENIIGKTDTDFWSSKLGKLYIKDDMDVMESKERKYVEELIEGPEGLRWHETFKNPVFDEKGEVIGTAGIARDITDRKETELIIIQSAEREALLRQIIETIRSSIDLDKTLTIICTEVAKIFKVQRATIVEFPDESDFSKWVLRKEYKIGKDVRGLDDIAYDIRAGAYNGQTVLQEEKNLIIDNIEESDTPDYYRSTYTQMGVKSVLSVPIKSKEDKFGIIFLSAINHYRHWTKEDVQLLESIASQVYVAIKQAGLFQSLRTKIQRETLLRKVTEASKQISNITAVKQKIVNQIGKAYGADRCYIRYYDKIKQVSSKAEVEYRKSDDIASVMNVEPNNEGIRYFRNQSFKENKIFVVKDADKYLEENNLQNSPVADYLNEIHTKSNYPFVAWEDDNVVIILALHYTKEPHYLSEDEIDFIDILTTQAGFVINQAELFETQKRTVKREKTLRELVNMIRQSLDIDDIIHALVFETGKMFNAQRSFFSKYDKELNTFLIPDKDSEYLMSDRYESFSKYGKVFTEIYGFFVEALITTKKTVFWADTEKLIAEYDLENTPTAINLRQDKIGAGLLVPILYEDNLFGIYVLAYEKPNSIDQEVVTYMERVAEQTSIGMNQAGLLEKERKAAQREALLREIIEIIRSSIDIEFVKHEIVHQVGAFLKADRVAFADYDFEKGNYFTSKNNEYRSSPKVQTFVGYDFAGTPGFIEAIRKIHLTGKDIIFSDLERHIQENNLQNTGIEDFYRHMGFMSSMAINIYHGDSFFGDLVITFENKRNISQEDISFIKTVSDQAGIAIYQSSLYQKEKESLEREMVLNQITETIRSNIDINQRKKDIVESIGKAFDTDLCILVESDSVTNKLLILDEFSEYRSSDDISSLVGTDFEKEAQIKFMVEMNKQKKELFVPDVKAFIKDNNLQGTPEEKFFKRTEMKTGLGISLYYQNDFIGLLGLYFIKEMKTFSEDEMNFVRILAVQAGNALHQSKLYELQRKTAHKERVLKDIISEIKLTRDLNQAYNTLLQKLSAIFNLNRTLFLESSKINPDELDIKYEYVINRKDMSVNNLVFPQVCIDEFLNLTHNLHPLILDDVARCYPEKTSDFFHKYKIQALMSVPLVKYNGETKVLGFIVLCSEEARKWTEEEIDLIKAVSDSVVSVIWEISKFLETEELRDTFVLTLAHDFQVPLVGERTAIEYLLNYSDCSFGTNREILQEILENNQNVSALLEKSVDIYNYESGKKELEMQKLQLGRIIQEVIILNQAEADLKNIKIDSDKSQESCFVKIDKKEILKVFSVLIENAIKHSDDNGEVKIEFSKQGNRVITSINNMGKPIPEDIQEKIFKRYEMAHAIERKIGAGTGLFLSKRIVEAHKGYIWFETGKTIGTTFYVSLPFLKS